jgi:hypothetical protein
MAIVIDGAKLGAKINYVTRVFKLTDKDSSCPITGMLIYSELKKCSQTHGAFVEQHCSRTTIQKLMSRVYVTNLLLCAC